MPLFFIVTGLFISEYVRTEDGGFVEWWRLRARKDFARLIIPALFTMAFILIVSSLSFILNDTYLKNPIELICNNAPDGKLNYINMLGNLWFLFALFFAKQFFFVLRYLIGKKVLPVVCFGRCMCVAFCVDWILYQKARRGGDWDSTLVLPDYTVLGNFYFLGKRQDWCYASGLLSSLYCFGMWGHIVLLSCVKIYIEQDCVY